jgi:phosphate transport system substrate-binding protein
MKTWMKLSVAILITAMICIPASATVIGSESQSFRVAGSTTVQPLMVEFQREFEKFANVNMSVSGGGSGVGVTSTLNGVASIGMLSRDLKSGEGPGLMQHKIGMDAVVVVVNNDAGLPVDEVTGMPDLSPSDLADIYSGRKTNWNELNGNDKAIYLISREEGSGTRDCFEDAVRKADSGYRMKDRADTVYSNGAVLATANTMSGAIGYVNMNMSVKDYSNISKVTLNGVDANSDTINGKTYKMARPLILVTKGEPDGMIKFFIEWILSENGQTIVEREGFVRIDGG